MRGQREHVLDVSSRRSSSCGRSDRAGSRRNGGVIGGNDPSPFQNALHTPPARPRSSIPAASVRRASRAGFVAAVERVPNWACTSVTSHAGMNPHAPGGIIHQVAPATRPSRAEPGARRLDFGRHRPTGRRGLFFTQSTGESPAPASRRRPGRAARHRADRHSG